LAKRFRGEDFFKSANQKQELPMAAMFVNGFCIGLFGPGFSPPLSQVVMM
jgi:hypothetical protein